MTASLVGDAAVEYDGGAFNDAAAPPDPSVGRVLDVDLVGLLLSCTSCRPGWGGCGCCCC